MKDVLLYDRNYSVKVSNIYNELLFLFIYLFTVIYIAHFP